MDPAHAKTALAPHNPWPLGGGLFRVSRPPTPVSPGAKDPPATAEDWCLGYLQAASLEEKLAPSPPPTRFQEPRPRPLRVEAPSRPAPLEVTAKAPKTLRKGALLHPPRRAQMIHTFLHHELQAAELMAWAVLAFPETPEPFRRGLLEVLKDELRHMGHYRDALRALGFEVGDFPVRDWFWSRIPRAQTPAQFVASMGMGLEGGNLDHADRYAGWFRELEFLDLAVMMDRVRDEEVAHVRFAATWFERFTGCRDFSTWVETIPEPMTPKLFKGRPFNRRQRLEAGMDAEFLHQLEGW